LEAGDALLKEPGDLVGRGISAVAFACDGVEFHFDGPILRSRSDSHVVSRAALLAQVG
jgi:hypothetical protein